MSGVTSAIAPGSIQNKHLADDSVDDSKLNLVGSDQEIKDALNAVGSAPIYSCRAWVNFNGAGTVAIRDSGNVSSITDNGTGTYTVNLATGMPDTNYCVVGSSHYASVANCSLGAEVSSVTACLLHNVRTYDGVVIDASIVHANFVR